MIRFGESTLKLGSMLTDGQVGIFKDRSAAAMSTFGDILPAQASGLLSSFTAARSDSWFPTEPWKCLFECSCTFCFIDENGWQFHDSGAGEDAEIQVISNPGSKVMHIRVELLSKWAQSETVVKVVTWRKREAPWSFNRSSDNQKKALCLPVYTVERNQ